MPVRQKAASEMGIPSAYPLSAVGRVDRTVVFVTCAADGAQRRINDVGISTTTMVTHLAEGSFATADFICGN
jgi:hypothetical protein